MNSSSQFDIVTKTLWSTINWKIAFFALSVLFKRVWNYNRVAHFEFLFWLKRNSRLVSTSLPKTKLIQHILKKIWPIMLVSTFCWAYITSWNCTNSSMTSFTLNIQGSISLDWMELFQKFKELLFYIFKIFPMKLFTKNMFWVSFSFKRGMKLKNYFLSLERDWKNRKNTF